MISKSFAVMAALMLLSTTAAFAGPAPKELYGKSIIVTWSEHRSQRELGQPTFRDVNVALSRQTYISTQGRAFNRYATGGRRREAIGTSGTTAGGGPVEIQFSGRTMNVFTVAKGGMARRFIIEFNESFTTCESQVTWAKQVGSDVAVGYNLNTGAAEREIRSATVTSTGCSVRDGNVFAQ